MLKQKLRTKESLCLFSQMKHFRSECQKSKGKFDVKSRDLSLKISFSITNSFWLEIGNKNVDIHCLFKFRKQQRQKKHLTDFQFKSLEYWNIYTLKAISKTDLNFGKSRENSQTFQNSSLGFNSGNNILFLTKIRM